MYFVIHNCIFNCNIGTSSGVYGIWEETWTPNVSPTVRKPSENPTASAVAYSSRIRIGGVWGGGRWSRRVEIGKHEFFSSESCRQQNIFRITPFIFFLDNSPYFHTSRCPVIFALSFHSALFIYSITILSSYWKLHLNFYKL